MINFFSSVMSSLKTFVTTLKAWVPQVTTVRFRYHADKKRLVRRYEYEEKIDQKGLLAHTGGDKPVHQLPIYRPTNPWTEKKATFGQNDYIDILGTNEIKPKDVMYNVPRWLRGIHKNSQELQVLIKKRKALQHGVYPVARPTKWRELNKRIMYLWKFMNRKTKTGPSWN